MFSLPTLASFAIPALFLLFLVTRFDIDLGDTWDRVREGNLGYYLLAIAVYYSSFLVRGLRWRILATNARLDNPAEPRISALHCGRLILLGWFVNTISWFRLGDAYRAYAFSEDAGASFSRTFGTIVAERVIDVVVVFLLLLVAAGSLVVTGSLRPSPLFLGAGFLLVVSVGVMLLLMRHLGMPVARLLPQRLADAYQRLYEGTMGSFRQLPLIGLLSVVAWLLEVGRLLLVVQALGLSLHAFLVLFVAVASALLTTVPITPGGLGVVEPGAVGLLTLQLSTSEAVSVALLDRSISYLSIIITGGFVFLLRQLRQRRVLKEPPPLKGEGA